MHMDADCDVAAAEKETSFFMRDKAIMLNFKNQPGDKDRTQFYNYQNSAKITKTSWEVTKNTFSYMRGMLGLGYFCIGCR